MTGDFSVKCKELKVTQSDLETISKDIKDLADKLKDCRQNLIACGLQQSDINAAISRVWQDIFEESCAMTSLQLALGNIVESYIQCEKAILNDIIIQNLNTSLDSSEKGTDKRSIWRKIWDAIFGKGKPDSYTATTDEQREAADEEMQKRINELLDSDKYSVETWQNATNEEKKQMLQEYMNEVEKILGVDVEDEVNFFYEENCSCVKI